MFIDVSSILLIHTFRNKYDILVLHYLKTNKQRFSDEPLLSAHNVNFHPTTEDLHLIEKWCKFTIAKALVKYLPPLKTKNPFSRLKEH